VFFPSDIDTLCSLACWAENELKLSAHDKIQKKLIGERDELERKAMIDPLTGTWNWQGLMEIFKPAFARAKRTKTIITLMKVHVDKVRYVTDSNLHEAEDMVLQEVVQRIRSSLRPHDLIGRHKDNEFLIFLADCNKDSAEMISQRMLRNVNIEPITAKDGRVMATLSIGMACNEDIGLWNWNDLIKIAESALFDVIVDGGNQSILRSNA
jgi:diguanylate cyclase (GGDEF)-like protein